MSSKQFTAQTFRFLYQVNADTQLLAIDLKVALTLTLHFNEKDNGGRAFPSCDTLATEAGVGEATVIRSVRRLEAEGHLRVVWGKAGRGHPNQYWMLVKPPSVRVLDAGKPSSETTRKPSSVKIKPSPVEENHLKNQGGSKEPPIGERESQALPVVLRPGGRTAVEESEEVAADETGGNLDHELAELQAAWPRPFADDEAADRSALAEARLHTPLDEIIAGARAWAEAADAPRFLQPLAKFLHGRCWEKEPPQRRQSQPTRQHHRNGHKIDMARLAFDMAADFEAEESLQ